VIPPETTLKTCPEKALGCLTQVEGMKNFSVEGLNYFEEAFNRSMRGPLMIEAREN